MAPKRHKKKKIVSISGYTDQELLTGISILESQLYSVHGMTKLTFAAGLGMMINLSMLKCEAQKRKLKIKK